MRRLALALALAASADGAVAQAFPGFVRRTAPGPHAAMEVAQPHPVRLPGVVTTRFELRPGECGAPCPADTERAQLVESGAGPPAGLLYTAFSVFIPRQTPATPGLPVTLAAFEQDGASLLAVEWREAGIVTTGPAGGPASVRVPANLVAARWHDILVEHRWSDGPEGRLRVWVNGHAGPPVTGATMAPGQPVRFAFGLSRAPVPAWTARHGSLPPPQIAYFAHVVRDADRAAVDIDLRVR